ncbi:alpha beta hydrolase fold protein [Diplodia corticola]|uniref:Alpha beta hydrolase fold protein n=1 Tax=Diplodia corticola TaxID=236234 RepID=A0A1J9QQW3_9PEZI|nr:alpha beta hydrolase fold protein [Diplodia corticola]OJD30848.1 alpha beta hydrolase fold protein [Diplodia corticola]
MSSPTPLPKSGLLARQQRRPATRQKIHSKNRAAAVAAACSGALLANNCQQQKDEGLLLTTHPYTDQRQSPLLRLPSEIRLLIYSYLLPHAHDITFHPLTRKHPATNAPVASHAVHIPGVWASIGIWTALLRTCRQLHDEGADALYGGNAFHFTLTSRERVWAFTPPPPPPAAAAAAGTHDGEEEQDDDGDAISSPTADRGEGGAAAAGEGGLSALNTPHARGLPINTLKTAGISGAALRRMRTLSLRIEEDLARPEPFRRVRAWLRELVDRLSGAAAPRGSATCCCLRELRVELVAGSFRYAGFPSFTHTVFWEFLPEKNDAVARQWQFVLEPLADLRGVRLVDVRGHVDEAFAGKLAGRMMQGGAGESGAEEDGEMEGIEYGTQTVRSGNRSVTKSMRKFYEPELDWRLEGD